MITDPDHVEAVDPFAPIMPVSTAAMVFDLIRDFPEGRLAVVLRPCELRTLIEMRKRMPRGRTITNAERKMLVIGVDCPGTFSQVRYADLVVEERSDALGRALLGGLPRMIRLLRPACRSCSWLTPIGADLSVGTFGFVDRGRLLITARDEALADDLDLPGCTDGKAGVNELASRKSRVAELSAARTGFQSNGTGDNSNGHVDLGQLLAGFARCTLCADCLDACPLYQGELAGLLGVAGHRDRERPSLSQFVSVSRWLASCTGCGMCEEICELDVPLTRLVSGLSREIQAELKYHAGDPGQKLPWAE
jgi:formate dehydrogenase subunit beta